MMISRPPSPDPLFEPRDELPAVALPWAGAKTAIQ